MYKMSVINLNAPVVLKQDFLIYISESIKLKKAKISSNTKYISKTKRDIILYFNSLSKETLEFYVIPIFKFLIFNYFFLLTLSVIFFHILY